MKVRVQTTTLVAPGSGDGVKYGQLFIALGEGDDWQQYMVPFVITSTSTPEDCWRRFCEGIKDMDAWVQRVTT